MKESRLGFIFENIGGRRFVISILSGPVIGVEIIPEYGLKSGIILDFSEHDGQRAEEWFRRQIFEKNFLAFYAELGNYTTCEVSRSLPQIVGETFLTEKFQNLPAFFGNFLILCGKGTVICEGNLRELFNYILATSLWLYKAGIYGSIENYLARLDEFIFRLQNLLEGIKIREEL